MKIRILIILSVIIFSCKKETIAETKKVSTAQKDKIKNPRSNKTEVQKVDTVEISNKHKINKILCDLDGDKLDETVEIVRSTINGKSGLRITYGNGKKTDYLGMGNAVLNQGFDEIDWVGRFEKASKDEIYWNNVSDDGEILTDEEIKEEDKIKLLNDGIFIHAIESCGGGIIYLKGDKYEWIQQE